MPYLNWITDDDLNNCVTNVIHVARDAKQKAEADFHRNVIDPFSALFQIGGFEIDGTNWLVSEKSRQAGKTLQNHIGDFHQKILGSVDGWENLGTGGNMDLIYKERRITAEIKNKHNTISGGLLIAFYDNLEELVMPNSSVYHGYTAYLVQIIPRRPQRFNQPFRTSNRKTSTRAHANELIRSIDGASFYELVTGDSDALNDLFNILPKVIQNIYGSIFSAADLVILDEFFKKAYTS